MTDKTPTYHDFDVLTVALQGNNLIEASAGTGKTYSIAILMLRLILEKQLAVNQVLMVTFTEAAVGELQKRVREFVRLAERYANGKNIEDETIKKLVNNAIADDGNDTVHQRLKDNVWLLDETAIMTIHGFCHQTLNDYALETGQVFGTELFTESDRLLEEQINHFWRRHVTTLPPQVLNLLGFDTLKENLFTLVRQHIGGKQYADYEETERYSNDFGQLEPLWEKAEKERNEKLKAFENEIQSDTFIRLIENSGAQKKTVLELTAATESGKSFVQLSCNAGGTLKGNKAVNAFPETIKNEIKDLYKLYNDWELQRTVFLRSRLFCFAIQEISRALQQYLIQNRILGFDDLIKNVYNALQSPHAAELSTKLQEKYKAVFVDEFQDTDMMQYAIFRKAFASETITFLIGDPKQSIYGFRKADIHTYFTARDNAGDRLYSMNTNYRSSVPMIASMNAFFRPEKDFDTFYFAGEPHSIDYMPVHSPSHNNKGALQYQGTDSTGITICTSMDTPGEQEASVANKVLEVLTDKDFQIEKNGQSRTVRPSDIGILVRKNEEGRNIKNHLAAMGIPSVIIDESRIFESPEAVDVLYIIEAVHEPNLSTIRRALMTHLIRWMDTERILKINEEKVLTLFQSYKLIWDNKGIFPAMIKLANDFSIEETFGKLTDGDRTLTNFFQLTEVLNQAERQKKYAAPELISWLKRSIGGLRNEGDEYQMRMESDEDAVKIVTIHKSKGLEYNIILYANTDHSSHQPFINYRNADTGNYLMKESIRATPQEKAWKQIQEEQENRRLLYVAITRAVYKCYLFHNTQKKEKTTLGTFYNAIFAHRTPLIAIEDKYQIESMIYNAARTPPPRIPLYAPTFRLLQPNWSKLSYTKISWHDTIVPKERKSTFDDAYDQFIFNSLRLGAVTGNLLHELLERIDFRQDTYWEEQIKQITTRYLPVSDGNILQHIHILLEHVLHANIHLGNKAFQLKEIGMYRRMSELEFDFPLREFTLSRLNDFASNDKSVQAKHWESTTVEGMMNGKIDLFFEHHGKYYIADWKSNYLGYQEDDYSKENVLRAMNENNYHLQYLIYTVAAKKYLENRIAGFDYETQFGGIIYIFLRGARANTANGIYTARPSLGKIQDLEVLIS